VGLKCVCLGGVGLIVDGVLPRQREDVAEHIENSSLHATAHHCPHKPLTFLLRDRCKHPEPPTPPPPSPPQSF